MLLRETGKTADEIKALAQKYMIDTYERFNFICERAEGMYLYDEKGNAYLDFYGGVAVNSTGNCNEHVTRAICEQAGEVVHTFNYPYTIPQVMLAERVCTALGYERIFYQNSGTEANEAMIKMARKYGIENYGKDRYHIVTAAKSFHGRTFGSMAATGQPDSAIQKGFGDMLSGFSYAAFNDIDSFRAQVNDNTIAIMVEPVQGEGGVNVAAPEFMRGLAELCREKGLLLLVDEIQTGWCRTGEVMGYMHYGIKPDIISMAKAMGGGLPIGAICTSDYLAKTFSPGSHGTTYGGNAVCCAAAYAQIGELLERDLAGNAKKMGAYLMERLRTLPGVKEVRGKGLLIGVEYAEPIGLALKRACIDKHLLVTLVGDRTIRLIPPLTLEKEHCDRAYEILLAATNEVLK